MSQITAQITQLFAAGRFAEAEKLCRSASQINPRDSTPLTIRGAIKIEQGDIKGALDLLTKAISLDPRNATAHFNLGVAQKKLMQFERAMAAFRTALGIAGPKPMILSAIGLTQLALGRSGEAAATLEQAARKDSQSPMAFLNWGEALKIDRQLDQAAWAFQKALSLRPDFVEALNSLGATFADAGKAQEAEEQFRRALAIEPKHAMARNNLGVLLKSAGKLKEALAEFEAANDADPEYAMAYFNKGTVLKEMQRPEAALKALKRAVELRPNLAEAHLVIGWIHFDNGLLSEAFAALTRAVQAKPDYADAHTALGALHRQTRNWKEARMCYDRALAVDFQHFEALLGLGQTFSGQGLFAAADECFRRALERQPEAPAARVALAKALFDQSKLDEAETCCREIIAVLPGNAEVHLTLGRVLSKQKRTEEAVEAFRRAIEIAPSSMRAYVNLAEDLQMLGRGEELQELFRQLDALATGADDFLKIKALGTLAEIAENWTAFERALDLAIRSDRTQDFSLHAVLKSTHFQEEQVARIIDKLNQIERSGRPIHGSSFYRARSLLLHEAKSYEPAWKDLARANRLLLEGSEVDPKARAAQRPELLEQLRSAGAFDLAAGNGLRQQAVFIFGMSRSGKSTLERFLSQADDWLAFDEYAIVDEIFRDLKVTREVVENGLDTEQKTAFADHFERRCLRYGDKILSFTAPGYIRYAKTLAESLPGARFIFIRRDDNDVLFRCLQRLYKRGNYYSYDVKECAVYIQWYGGMMSVLSDRLGDRARTVSYEDLVADTAGVVNSLWAWLEVKPPARPVFEIANDVGCSLPYREVIAAELGGSTG